MTKIRPIAALAIAAIAMLPSQTNASASHTAAADTSGVIADYYGTKIDLSEDWAGAQACAIDDTTAVCFDTEAELDRYLGESPDEPGNEAARASCSSSTRLYAGTSFGTPVVAITVRLSWRDLSPIGFDNKTRSYKIGACATTFAKNSGGGGSHLSAGAGTQASTMPNGWDQVISSLHLA